ncbi:MAG: magnesium and cobalt transport protein CorA, partial [Nostocales cyanobacterium]
MIRNIRQLSKVIKKTSSRKKYYHPPGTAPGTIIIDEDSQKPQIYLIDYNQINLVHQEIKNPEDCQPYLDTKSVSWVDVQGLGNQDILERLGQVFELHPLVLEDVVN